MTDWFDTLRSIVNRHEPGADAQALPRAAAALLLEMAVTDDGVDTAELDIVHAAMARGFGIGASELDELLAQAQRARREAVSLHEFTRQLRTGLAPGQAGDLVEWLWRVAFADARLDKHKELMVRRVADLLGVSHMEFIRRKHQARATAGASGSTTPD